MGSTYGIPQVNGYSESKPVSQSDSSDARATTTPRKLELFVGTKFQPHLGASAPIAPQAPMLDSGSSFINLLNSIIYGTGDAYGGADNFFEFLFSEALRGRVAFHTNAQMLRNLNGGAYTGTSRNVHFNTEVSKNLVALKDAHYSPEVGNTLAQIANDNARETSTFGWCLKGVRTAMEKAGVSNGGAGSLGGAACDAPDKLAENSNFRQVNVSREDLINLPAGCVIIWDKGEGHEYGHITTTLGNGQSASDHIEDLARTISTHPQAFAVFVPVAKG